MDFVLIKVDFKYGENVDNKYQEVVRGSKCLTKWLPKEYYSISAG
jgi:hypothetical protein